ncbi:MAG: UDP-N-acetylmuramate dehydrogenase [Pyramidobacter sp.]|nr:UDP-N-acetylmuramate dehydrogenase [Pyramidobacter sp.]
MTPDISAALNKSHLLWSAASPLKNYCHWRIGGPADYLVEPRSVCETALARRIALDAGIPYLVIGHGSNMLFDDAGYRGMVIRLSGKFAHAHFENNRVYAEAGTWTPALARACASRGLSGLEHAVGIPGNFGGLVFMNGGSMRQNIGDVTAYVDFLDENNEPRRLSAENCEFTYRHSVFQGHNDWIVTGAELRLTQSDADTIRRAMLDVMQERKGKFPLELPNCGSVFSNDADLYAKYGPPGMVIDRAGLKGTRLGGVCVSERHANFIVNTGGATSADVFGLIRIVRHEILERTGFTLKCEVRYAAPDGRCDRLDLFL